MFWIIAVSNLFCLVSEPLDEDEAETQRRTIVAKYDRGYQPDELEEWEDASYIVYQVTDRYGFMQ